MFLSISDYISSLLAYWWMGLGMIAIVIFLIYNSFVAIAVLPQTHYHPSKIPSKYTIENKSNEKPSTPTVYMHVFVENYDEFNKNNYLPYVQALEKRYTNFNYNFFVVLNDATHDVIDDFSDEQKNEVAFNSLWDDKKFVDQKKLITETPVKFISLSKYMDSSPLRKYWRVLPQQFIGFLARCIAIWDKGGVAFDPIILTPKSPDSVYLSELHNVLGKFQSKNKMSKKTRLSKKPKKKLNNIRDIIEDLEKEDRSETIFTDSLSEAENFQTSFISLKTKRNAKPLSFNQPVPVVKQNNEELDGNSSMKEDVKSLPINLNKPSIPINSTKGSGIVATQNMLSKFLEFFFHLNSKNLTSISQSMKDFTSDKIYLNDLSKNTTPKIEPSVESEVKISSDSTNKTSSDNESPKLIIDLKGNLIATEIACHAFIGTVFSNVLHHTDEESLTDFIINELSLFCKGSLSSCNIEVILL